MSSKNFMSGAGGDFGGGGASGTFTPAVINTGGATGSWTAQTAVKNLATNGPAPPVTPIKNPGTPLSGQNPSNTDNGDNYGHEGKNYVSPASKEFQLNFLPNVLDNYDVYT